MRFALSLVEGPHGLQEAAKTFLDSLGHGQERKPPHIALAAALFKRLPSLEDPCRHGFNFQSLQDSVAVLLDASLQHSRQAYFVGCTA